MKTPKLTKNNIKKIFVIKRFIKKDNTFIIHIVLCLFITNRINLPTKSRNIPLKGTKTNFDVNIRQKDDLLYIKDELLFIVVYLKEKLP